MYQDLQTLLRCHQMWALWFWWASIMSPSVDKVADVLARGKLIVGTGSTNPRRDEPESSVYR
jgi:hypothetical protein